MNYCVLRLSLALIVLISGTALLSGSVVGEIIGMRIAEQIPEEHLRFRDDLKFSHDETMAMIGRKNGESDLDYSRRINGVVQGSLAHLHNWYDYDPQTYSQRVSFIENPFLNVLGRYSGLPQFERYHFSDYRKTLERGFGLCGDHAIVMSQLLDKEGIDNELLAFSGHVIVEVKFDDEKVMLLDSDFGVIIENVDGDGIAESDQVINSYAQSGYSPDELQVLREVYSREHIRYESVYSFMRLRYVFERVSYVLKWLLPIMMIAWATVALSRARRLNAAAVTLSV